MAFVITNDCVDVMDRSCLEECPVDCIYEGRRRLYIHPTECIDCGACEIACPTEAIVPDRRADHADRDDNRAFFDSVLPGRGAPLGSPGGAAGVGALGIDVPSVDAVEAS